MKKCFCMFLAVCITVLFSGCKKSGEILSGSEGMNGLSLSDSESKSVSLLYSYNDTFDPYTAKDINNIHITSLLYDSLFKTDNNFAAANVLAESFETDENTFTVTLRDASFSDGDKVTAADVVYSYGLAKNCDRYSYNFYEIKSIEAVNSRTVKFTVSYFDPYFANLLTFPIIKSDTSGKKDADGQEIAPIGCGRYVLSDDRLSLKLNENYYGKKGVIKTVNLINSPDSDSTSHYVEVGAASIYYNDDNNSVRMSAKKYDVNLNRLVYIGINSSYGSLQSKEMRYAISSAIDRDAVCHTAYYGNAEAAKGFFNSCFKDTSAVQTIENKANSKITVENLEKIGYNNMNSAGYYANSNGNNPRFSLLVNSENALRVAAAKLIAEQCKASGIQIDVVECGFEQYLSRLASNDFQLYIGEVQILDNMDMSNLVIAGGSAAYGVNSAADSTSPDANSSEDQKDGNQASEDGTASGDTDSTVQKNTCESVINSYRLGECGISDVAGTLITEMPQIPICYRKGVLFYDSAITGGVTASSSDIYFSIENYEF